MLKLIPYPKHYEWGSDEKVGLLKEIYTKSISGISNENLRSQLADKTCEKKWAELWLGTHTSGMAFIPDKNLKLLDYLKSELPFLFKILSVKKCLSIQIHPDSESAIKLNFLDPTNYPDKNPKPEMAIAIDYLDAFCGFCSPEEIMQNLCSYPAVLNFLKNKNESIVTSNFKTPESSFEDSVKEIIILFNSMKAETLNNIMDCLFLEICENESKSDRDLVMLKLKEEFGNDPGILVSLLLKLVHLKPLESIEIPALVPHAYISGNVFEVMAPSDNVIRLGLTPKFKDAENFIELFEYNYQVKTKVKTECFILKSTKSSVLHFCSSFGNYFDVFIVKSSEKEHLDENTVDIEFTEYAIVLNFGKPVILQEKELSGFESGVIEAGKLRLDCDPKDHFIIFCSRNVKFL
jgi:mannose-6-phosphate isomerase